MTMQYGSLNYDVPRTNREAYSKLRALFKRKAIMQTASSYLFPWGMAKDVDDGLKKINTNSDGTPIPHDKQVRYYIFKYDEAVSGKALEQSARDALGRMLKQAKATVNKMVDAMHTEEGEDDDPARSARVACKRAESLLRDARGLALIFNLTDNLNAGFLAYEAWVQAKRQEIRDWVKSQNPNAIDFDDDPPEHVTSLVGANGGDTDEADAE